ncbi:MAG: type II secretion system F family protein [Phycisphaerae bacterium]|nr:type II secretion system F family protein [Phycisphaerae bacterium]
MASVQAAVYSNLSIMLEAGVAVRQCLGTAVSPAKGELGKAWREVAQAVWQGDGLAEAMRKHPKEFAELDVLVIEAGEVSGGLPETLKRLSQWYSFRERMKKMVISGMMLPVLVLTAAALVIPFPRWFMDKISGWGYLLAAAKPLAVLLVPMGVIWGIVRYTPKTGVLRKLVDGAALKIPLVGRAVKQLALSRYLRAFHTLFKAGLPMIRCAQTSAEVTGNAVVREWVRPGAESARAGHPVSEGFGREFPKEFLDAWLVGEESGKLEEVSERLARIAAEKAEWTISQVCKWVPILIYGLICIWLIWMIFAMWGQI